MILNALKSAVRAARRHLGYTAINVIGLAVGIAVCLLITLYVRHELSYDDFHEDADRIYRVVTDWDRGSVPSTFWPAIQTVAEKNPALPVAPFFENNETVLTHEAQSFTEGVFVAQPSFFDVFTFPLRTGSATEALAEPRSVVIAPSVAEKYFGDSNPVGKTLEMNGFGADRPVRVQVTGVLEPIPHASHFHPKILLSLATFNALVNFEERKQDDWGSYGFRAYLKIPEGASPERLADQLTRQVKEQAPGELELGGSL